MSDGRSRSRTIIEVIDRMVARIGDMLGALLRSAGREVDGLFTVDERQQIALTVAGVGIAVGLALWFGGAGL